MPSPTKPSLHSQLYVPGSLVQSAFSWHTDGSLSHSSISVKKNNWQETLIKPTSVYFYYFISNVQYSIYLYIRLIHRRQISVWIPRDIRICILPPHSHKRNSLHNRACLKCTRQYLKINRELQYLSVKRVLCVPKYRLQATLNLSIRFILPLLSRIKLFKSFYKKAICSHLVCVVWYLLPNTIVISPC